MIARIEILRPINGLMATAGFVIAAVLLGTPLAPIPVQLLIAALIVFLQSGAGMVLNDYFDWQIDRSNRPYRVIPSGRMSLNGAFNYGIGLFGASILLALLFLPITMAAFIILNAAVSALYSWGLKKTPLGHIAVSWLTASVFVLAMLLVGQSSLFAMILFALVFCGNLTRELAKGIEDYKGDKAAGANTLAVAVGMDVASWLAIMLGFLTATIIPLPVGLGLTNAGYLPFASLAIALIAYACYLILQNKPARAQKMMKYAMAMMLLALILGKIF
jgi:geranylgeranylglycerol-phosphate geranylgeranyltransferase